MKLAMRLAAGAARSLPTSARLFLYNVPWVARSVRGLLNWTIGCGLQDVEIAAGPLAGMRLVLDLKQEKFFWLGTYEPWVQEALVEHAHVGSVAWDVGACLGYHTLLLRRVCGPGRVVALEPSPTNRARLETNLALNDANDVLILSVAAGSRAGDGQLVHNGWESRLEETTYGPTPITNLDSLATQLPPPALVKLDVEGSEDLVLAGASRLLEEVRPTWIVEVHGEPGERAVERLKRAGYGLRWIGKHVTVRSDFPVGGPKHVVAIP